MAVVDDLAWADAYPGQGKTLGEIFCLTFIRGVDPAEALRRLGALPDTVVPRTWSDIGALHNFDAGYPEMASALPLGTWTVVFEPDGFNGSHLTTTLSSGTEAVSVLRHDYASPAFTYAVNGELITHFDPTSPDYRYGTDPDRLLTRMQEAGFTKEDGDTTRSLRLTEQLTGVLPTYEALTGPLTSAQVEPWFSEAPKKPAGRPGHDGPIDAITEVRRLTTLHNLTNTPGLTETLATAERGEQVKITPESPLGQQVRTWLTESRRASWSMNDHNARHRMTDPERRRAFDLGWLTQALGATLTPTPKPPN